QPVPAALGNQKPLTRLGQVADHLLGGGIDHCGAHRYRQDQILALGTSTLGRPALLAVRCIETTGVAVVDQRVEVLVGLQKNGAAITTIAPIGATLFDEFLATETHHAVTAVTGLYKNRYFIDEFHGNASRRMGGLENRNIRVLQRTQRKPIRAASLQEPHRIQKQKSPVA